MEFSYTTSSVLQVFALWSLIKSYSSGHWSLGARNFKDLYTLNYVMETNTKPWVSNLAILELTSLFFFFPYAELNAIFCFSF